MIRWFLFFILLGFSNVVLSQGDYKLVSIYKEKEKTIFVNIKGYDYTYDIYQLSDSIYYNFRMQENIGTFDFDGKDISGSYEIEITGKTVIVNFSCINEEF